MSQIAKIIDVYKRKINQTEQQILQKQRSLIELLDEMEQSKKEAQDFSDENEFAEQKILDQMVDVALRPTEIANLPLRFAKIRDHEKNLWNKYKELEVRKTELDDVINGLMEAKKALLKKVEMHTILFKQEQQSIAKIMEAKEDAEIDDFSIFQHFSR